MKAIYIRTSVADADGAAQLHQLRQVAKARGWRGVREFVDLGQSGSRASRPALDELRAACKRGAVSEVMTVALDRLGRNLRELLLLLDELAAGGCAVISLREGIDLSTPTGKLMTAIFGALAEFERGLIRQRIQAGIEKVRATGRSRSGRPLGRPRRVVDVERAAQLRASGRSWRAIAVAMKIPRRTVARALAQNPPPDSARSAARAAASRAGRRKT
ncbi:MAG: recombinase family protein [Archangium sp.]|nr:recombinase family protein [Archangium sp.]